MANLFTPREGESLEIGGIVERVTFHSDESGWTVARLRPDRQYPGGVTVVGLMPPLSSGEEVRLAGRFVVDPKWGEQFRVDLCRVVPPSTTAGLVRWLSSGAIRGIGPTFAARLVERFGLELPRILDEEPARLAEVPGFGKVRRERFLASWAEQRGDREILVYLQGVGASPALARRIRKQYGERAVEVVRTDPYRLALEVDGVGFLTADRIARAAGLPPDAPRRAAAGLLHLLGQRALEGHVWTPREALVPLAVELLGEGAAPIPPAVDELLATGLAVGSDLPGEEGLVAPRALALAEAAAARRLARLLAAPARLPPGRVEDAAAEFERAKGLVLAPRQHDAVIAAAGSKVFVLTGGPGTGKTTIVSALLSVFAARRARILLGSPTGRAARRLAESTGLPAKTLHRMLEWNPATGGFARDETNPLEADLVVVDEASMIDLPLFASLLRAIPAGARLVLVGDADQLPSVGPGRVLEDVLASGVVPAVRLEEIFRQAGESLIVANAHRIRRGEMPSGAPSPEQGDFFVVERDDPAEVARMVVEMATERIPRAFGLDPVTDLQVLTPMNRGTLGAAGLNARLQEALNPTGPAVERGAKRFRAGDRVIQLENDYDRDVFNGDIGRVTAVDPDGGVVEVTFDDRRTEYEGEELDRVAPAWAVTVHKSQGSEYPAVVLALHGQHFPLLQRNLLYTAVTRGRRLVVVVGSRRALALAVGNARTTPRRTLLAERLRSAAGGGSSELGSAD